MAEEGADIIAVDICEDISTVSPYYALSTEEELAQTSLMVEALGRKIVTRVADVRDLDILQDAFDAGVDRLGPVDIVVANAGIASYGLSWELTAQQWKDMIDVNLTGVFNTVKVSVPSMVETRRGGSISFTSSIGGLKGLQHSGHYVAAKHGIVGLMRTMANELGPHSIRVNTVHPTTVDTVMVKNKGTYSVFTPDDPEPSEAKAMPGFMSLNALPVPWVESVDISNALVFLASDEARYITGVTLPIDAGAGVK
ncbi:SDR family mycofactocin-dependent oxidoreductase [Rhodococcus erythropolis]|nr:SDR family mycofactocin-dependent oxidoreductase [Rhodococcus erythropolis]